MKVRLDFVQAATDGVVAVSEGRIPPINPMDPPRSHVHVYNNIFFSLAVDARDIYQHCGGDATAHKAASRDLQGVVRLNELDIEELHTLLTAVIDYQGQVRPSPSSADVSTDSAPRPELCSTRSLRLAA